LKKLGGQLFDIKNLRLKLLISMIQRWLCQQAEINYFPSYLREFSKMILEKRKKQKLF
jgi:hypothetical protein